MNRDGAVFLPILIIFILISAASLIIINLSITSNPVTQIPAQVSENGLRTVAPTKTDDGLKADITTINDCYDSDKYFIVDAEHEKEVGNTYLVKYKTSSEQNFTCEYKVEDNDYEINIAWPLYYLDLVGDILVLDSGTGPPPRGLHIYNLAQKKEIYAGSYNSPTKIEDDFIEFWKPVDSPTTKLDCLEADEIEAAGLGIGYEDRVKLEYSTLNETYLEESRCSPRQ